MNSIIFIKLILLCFLFSRDVIANDTKIDTEDLKRNLFKSSDNTGFIIEIFPSKQVAGSNLDVLKAMQSLKEQAMAKVSVLEGSR